MSPGRSTKAVAALTAPSPATPTGQGAGGEASRQAPFVEREVRVASEDEAPEPVVLADSASVEIEVGEFVVPDEEAEPVALEQAVLVEEEEPAPDGQGAATADDDAANS